MLKTSCTFFEFFLAVVHVEIHDENNPHTIHQKTHNISIELNNNSGIFGLFVFIGVYIFAIKNTPNKNIPNDVICLEQM